MLHHLDFAKVHDFFAARIGAENVLVLPFELMTRDRERYATLLASFMNVPAEVIQEKLSKAPVENARKGRTTDIARMDYEKRRFFVPKIRPLTDLAQACFLLAGGDGHVRQVAKTVERKVDDYFAPRNDRLRDLLLRRIGVDIGHLGYSLPPV